MVTQKILLSLSLLLLLVSLTTGCTSRTPIGENITPEASAVHYAKEMKAGNFRINIDSVKAVQKVEVNNLVLVLIQYNGMRLTEGAEACVFVMETEAVFFGWDAHGGSGSCHKINDPTDILPITASGGRDGSSSIDSGYSTVYGITRDPQITNIVVTWEDGHIQQVEIMESTYIAAREGGFDMKKIEAFNDQNELVYTTEHRG